MYLILCTFLQMASALANRAIGAIMGSAVADAAGINSVTLVLHWWSMKVIMLVFNNWKDSFYRGLKCCSVKHSISPYYFHGRVSLVVHLINWSSQVWAPQAPQNWIMQQDNDPRTEANLLKKIAGKIKESTCCDGPVKVQTSPWLQFDLWDLKRTVHKWKQTSMN